MSASSVITVLERGWLSSNNIVLTDGNTGDTTLVDTGHCAHAEQTLALVRHALQGRPLTRIVNTHLHSDHCGGNAALQRHHPGAELLIPPGLADAVAAWDVAALGFEDLGQMSQRFVAHGVLRPGEQLLAGGRRWEALAAPGHDPHSLVLFDAQDGTLISTDALWENGFGVVFPELAGKAAFDEVAAVLDLVARLGARWVIPGHGAPFSDVDAALRRARQRLAYFRREPARHAHSAAKALLTYRVLEAGSLDDAALLHWFTTTPLMQRIHARASLGGSLQDGYTALRDELLRRGVLQRIGTRIRPGTSGH